MNSKEIVPDAQVIRNLDRAGFQGYCADEGRLMLAELLLKSAAGYYNSHTEENYVRLFGLRRSDRTLTKRGARFVCALFYTHSHLRPEGYRLMDAHRAGGKNGDRSEN